tara:strand:+ start:3551 stop:4030 length:480 start_codon:yes stop_codon:yes gene_type:complete
LKKLILIRHAKSSWEFNVQDIERPLSNRGKSDAKLMSIILKDLNIDVDHIYSSNSKRTLQTSQIFVKNLELQNVPTNENERLYDFSGEKVESFIRAIPSNLNTVIIFTHNNTCTNLLEKFAGLNKHVPTCGILIFDFDVSLWDEIESGKCDFYFPKHFK